MLLLGDYEEEDGTSYEAGHDVGVLHGTALGPLSCHYGAHRIQCVLLSDSEGGGGDTACPALFTDRCPTV